MKFSMIGSLIVQAYLHGPRISIIIFEKNVREKGVPTPTLAPILFSSIEPRLLHARTYFQAAFFVK